MTVNDSEVFSVLIYLPLIRLEIGFISQPRQKDKLCKGFFSTNAPTKIGYNEYIDCTLSTGRSVGGKEDWPLSVYAKTKKIESIGFIPVALSGDSLKGL